MTNLFARQSRTYKIWTNKEEKRLVAMSRLKMTVADIAVALHRTPDSIRGHCEKLGLPVYTQEQRKKSYKPVLTEEALHAGAKLIQEAMDRHVEGLIVTPIEIAKAVYTEMRLVIHRSNPSKKP